MTGTNVCKNYLDGTAATTLQSSLVIVVLISGYIGRDEFSMCTRYLSRSKKNSKKRLEEILGSTAATTLLGSFNIAAFISLRNILGRFLSSRSGDARNKLD